ncbi:MAG: TonB-dependent receptor, partial [Cytophagales bacterium]|nr:TonB-dependent receptor [Cytophagales bacterium]
MKFTLIHIIPSSKPEIRNPKFETRNLFVSYFDIRISIFFYLIIVLLFSFNVLKGQDWQGGGGRDWKGQQLKGIITGKIIDAKSAQTVEYATITLYDQKDSSLVTGTVSNQKGKFEIEASFGVYNIRIEFISYEPKVIKGIKVSKEKLFVDIGTVNLTTSTVILSEIEVKGEKSRLEVGLDKKVFNVEKDLSSIGGTAADVLENIPSVSVDVDGNVSLRGSSNVRILVDGKPSGLTGISSTAVLEQLPANSIESIEVITNPSVRYDAEGLSGIINIILKKEKKKGMNGLLSITGAYPSNHNGSVNFNYGFKNINLFGSYNIRNGERPGYVKYNRRTIVNDTITYLDEHSDFNRTGWSHNMRAGVDYMFNKNTVTASVLYRTSNRDRTRDVEYREYDFKDSTTDEYIRKTWGAKTDNNIDYALSYKKIFSRKGQVLTADVQYSTAFEEEDMDIVEQHFSPASTMPLLQRTFSKENQNNFIFQADYVQPVSKQGRIEAGYKSSIKNIDKDYDIEEDTNSTNNWIYLSAVSNHFIYNEVIYAAYGMYSSKVKKISYQVGVRAEQTYVTSELKETDETSIKNYLNFFPSVHLSYELNKEHKMQLSYSRRIRRPSFWNLNPFNSYADPLNQWIGNPDLNPELTSSFEIGDIKYWEKNTLSSSIYYRHTDDVIQRIRQLDDSSGISITQPENLSSRESFGVEMTFSKNIFKWWKLNGSFNYFRSIVDGGNLGEGFASDFYSWTGRLSSQMTVLKDMDIQIMFNYRAPRETTQGMRREIYFIDIGIKKRVLKGKGTISLRLSDVLNSRKYAGETNGPGFYIYSEYKRLSQRIYAG